jgi:hypothetical protein
MISQENSPQTPVLMLNAWSHKTAKLVRIESLQTGLSREFYATVRVAVADGERLAALRGPLSALRGWKAFRAVALGAGLVLEPTGPDDWDRAVFAAMERGEVVR